MMFSACGFGHHHLTLDQGYALEENAKIEVEKVRNKSGKALEVQAETLLQEALKEEFRSAGLLWVPGSGPRLTLACRILDYEKGNAFMRWMIPGWGRTVLKTRCKLIDQDRVIGKMEANRSIDIGGMLEVDGWIAIFEKTAKDIVADIKASRKGVGDSD